MSAPRMPQPGIREYCGRVAPPATAVLARPGLLATAGSQSLSDRGNWAGISRKHGLWHTLCCNVESPRAESLFLLYPIVGVADCFFG